MHIITQFFIHIGLSLPFLIIFFAALYIWTEKNKKAADWIYPGLRNLLVISFLLIAAILPLREPFDLHLGNNTILKTPFDQASWFIGGAFWAWVIYRLLKKLKKI